MARHPFICLSTNTSNFIRIFQSHHFVSSVLVHFDPRELVLLRQSPMWQVLKRARLPRKHAHIAVGRSSDDLRAHSPLHQLSITLLSFSYAQTCDFSVRRGVISLTQTGTRVRSVRQIEIIATADRVGTGVSRVSRATTQRIVLEVVVSEHGTEGRLVLHAGHIASEDARARTFGVGIIIAVM